MLRKLFLLTLSAVLLTGIPFGHAEESLADDDFSKSLIVEKTPPTKPLVVEGEYIRVTAEYVSEDNCTHYTAELINDPVRSDGTPMTARDLLFSLYVYLDPAYAGETPLAGLDIPGLESYRRQVSEERLAAAYDALTSIRAAGPEHVWSAADGWNQSIQETYWTLHAEYMAACQAEFPACAEAIVNYCDQLLSADVRGAFGKTPEEIAANDGLRTGYAMVQWGYASASGNTLTGKRSGKVWQLDSETPTFQDFAHELSLAYDGDLGACWAVETTGTYTPALPALEEAFLDAALEGMQDSVSSVSGIRMVDDMTLEILLSGIEMHAARAMFGQPALSLATQGDGEQWSPEAGRYGHPFGDLSGIASYDGPVLLEYTGKITF